MSNVFDIFNQFATDPNTELDGKWVPIGPALKTKEDGSADPESAPQVKVARMNNRRYSRMLVTMYEANKSVLDMKNDHADKRNEEITIELLANTILLGWKNMVFKGEPLPTEWDVKTAKKMLEVKDFRDLVVKQANDAAHYKLVQEGAAAKN